MVNNNRSYRTSRCNCAPSCSQGNNATLRQLQAIDLAMVETALYLDSYPENRAALAYYNKLLEEHEHLSASLSRDGRPMTHQHSGKGEGWMWINSPWPWDIEANL